MPVAGRCGSVRRERSYEIRAEGEKRSTAAELVVVHCGELVMDSREQKRYGEGAVIVGQLVTDMRGLSEPARCGEVAEESKVEKKCGVEVVIEGWWTVRKRYGVGVVIEEQVQVRLQMSGLSEPCHGGPSLREGRHL